MKATQTARRQGQRKTTGVRSCFTRHMQLQQKTTLLLCNTNYYGKGNTQHTGVMLTQHENKQTILQCDEPSRQLQHSETARKVKHSSNQVMVSKDQGGKNQQNSVHQRADNNKHDLRKGFRSVCNKLTRNEHSIRFKARGTLYSHTNCRIKLW